MVHSLVQDSLAFLPLAFIHFRLPKIPRLTHSVQTYFSWNMWRGRGRDQVDWGHGEPPTLYDTGILNINQPRHLPILTFAGILCEVTSLKCQFKV